MENKVTIWKNAVIYGLIGGILMIAFSLILWLLGMMESKGLGMLTYLILAFAMFLGAKNWRDRFNEGWMTYGEAFKTGFFVVLISSVLLIIYNYIFFNFIDPEFIENQMATAEEKILEANPNISDADFDKAMAIAKRFSSTTMLAVMGFIANVIFGTIIASLVAIFAKNENKSVAV